MLGVAAAVLGGACGTFESEVIEAPPDAADVSEAPSAVCAEPDLVNDPNAAPDVSCGRDLASDPDHCGACGRSCGGDACENGLCQRVRFPDDAYEVTAAWAGGDRVFAFRRTGGLEVMSGDGTRRRINESVNVERATGDETHLYAMVNTADGKQYRRIATDDGFEESLGALGSEAGVLAVGEKSVYLASPSSILRLPKSGSSLTTQSVTGARSISVRGDDAFWVARDRTDANSFAVYGPMSGNDEPPRLAVSAEISALATDAEYAYFGDVGRGIVRVPLTGGRAQDVAKESGQIGAVAVMGEHVYWAVKVPPTSLFSIKRVHRCGGLPLVVTEALPTVDAMSFAGGKLYVMSRPHLYAVAQ
jgi:hypothetical protein